MGFGGETNIQEDGGDDLLSKCNVGWHCKQKKENTSSTLPELTEEEEKFKS